MDLPSAPSHFSNARIGLDHRQIIISLKQGARIHASPPNQKELGRAENRDFSGTRLKRPI